MEILIAQITVIVLIVILCFGLGYMYNEYKTDRRRQKILDRVNKLLEEDLKELVSEHKKHNENSFYGIGIPDLINMSSFKEELDSAIESKWSNKELKELKNYKVIGANLIGGLKKGDMVIGHKYEYRTCIKGRQKSETKVKVLVNGVFYSQSYKKFKLIKQGIAE